MDGIGETSATYEVPQVKEVSRATKTAFVYAVSDGQNNTIPIPKDFYYVGGNINSGIVISDNKDDEKRYANSSNGDVGKDLKGNQFVWIPCLIKNYHKTNWGVDTARWDISTGDLEKEQIKKYGGFYIGRYEAGVSVLDKSTGTFIDSVTFGGKSLNGDVTAIVNSYKWGWQNTDYFARSSNMSTLIGSTYGENKASGNVVVKAGAIPYYHADFYTAKEMSENLYNKTGITSGLVTGTQWDVMIKYMQNNGVAISGNECNWGNYDNVSLDEITGYYTNVDSNGNTDGFKNKSGFTTNSTIETCVLLTTGASEKVKKMNLYDVAGNLEEWTDESAYVNIVYSTTEYNTFMTRGGSFYHYDNSYQVCLRNSYNCVNTSTTLGFRPVLYIK